MHLRSKGSLFASVLGLWVAVISAPADAAALKITTENYPPFNIGEAGKDISGISTEIVKAVFEKAGVDYSMDLMARNRAHNMALNEGDTCVFSATITEERKSLFKWVGPLVSNDVVFFAADGSDITLGSLEDAKSYRVGGNKGGAATKFLQGQGFKVDEAPQDPLNAKKLAAKRIDLWATGRLLGLYQAKSMGTKVKEVLIIKETVTGLACNKGVDDAVIAKLQTALKTLQDDGTVKAITAKYE